MGCCAVLLWIQSPKLDIMLHLLRSVRHVESHFGMRAPESVERLYKRELGGGALLDIGVYPLSFIQVPPKLFALYRGCGASDTTYSSCSSCLG